MANLEIAIKAIERYQQFHQRLLASEQLLPTNLHDQIDQLIVQAGDLDRFGIDAILKLQMINLAAIQTLVDKTNQLQLVVYFAYPEDQLREEWKLKTNPDQVSLYGFRVGMNWLRESLSSLSIRDLGLVPLDIQIRLLEQSGDR